jgi:hypothetical protein
VTGAVRFVFLATLGAWVGVMAFLSFVVAPTAFAVLEAPRAGDLVGALFPRYYATGVSLGVAALGAALFLQRRGANRRAWTLVVASLVAATGVTAYAGGIVQPQARRLRAALHAPAAGTEVRAQFAAAHRTAVVLNGVALLAALAGLGAAAGALRQ